jgi:hypothetical protein
MAKFPALSIEAKRNIRASDLFPPQRLSLDAAERSRFSKDHPHQRTEFLIGELSRAALMRTLHQRGSNKRQPPNPGEE